MDDKEDPFQAAVPEEKKLVLPIEDPPPISTMTSPGQLEPDSTPKMVNEQIKRIFQTDKKAEELKNRTTYAAQLRELGMDAHAVKSDGEPVEESL